ncbi:hypothetical protein VTK73DRAFT_969 [Phialemonium thermophilum]|uniref:Uncharacterized protein n=1 Tax=Phialemonium thermophilum TaxID=223376 RepID=A0ABR3VU23_9PEZI
MTDSADRPLTHAGQPPYVLEQLQEDSVVRQDHERPGFPDAREVHETVQLHGAPGDDAREHDRVEAPAEAVEQVAQCAQAVVVRRDLGRVGVVATDRGDQEQELLWDGGSGHVEEGHPRAGEQRAHAARLDAGCAGEVDDRLHASPQHHPVHEVELAGGVGGFPEEPRRE